MNHSTPFKARPTTYKGIEMRSRTEAAYAARLDELGFTWEYEPRCFASEAGQYLPDFRVADEHGPVYVEVKGALDDPDPVRRRMEIIWASEASAALHLAITSTGDHWYSAGQGKAWVYSNARDLPPTLPAPEDPSAFSLCKWDEHIGCCGHNGCGTHIGPVGITTGTKKTTVTGDGDVVQVPGGPGGLGRGTTVEVSLWGECGTVGTLRLSFHKGEVHAAFDWPGCGPGDMEQELPWPLMWRD